MTRPKTVRFGGKSTNIAKSIGHRISYYPSRKNPLYMEIVSGNSKHLIHIGYDKNSGYFISTSLSGEPLWDKRNLTKKEVDELTKQALSGKDIQIAIQRRMTRGEKAG